MDSYTHKLNAVCRGPYLEYDTQTEIPLCLTVCDPSTFEVVNIVTRP